MKIKCPSCSTVLNIPESAAGKIVKCPCGKQLRAPGGAAQPAVVPTAARSTTQRPAAGGGKATAARPAAAGGASAGGFDPGLFDELTEQDLQPVRPVARPGKKEPAVTGAKKTLGAALSDLEKETAEQKKEHRQGAAKELWSSIGILVLLGLLRLGFNVYFLMNVDAEVEALGADPTFDGDSDLLLKLVRAVYIINISIGATFLTCAALIFKFPMTCTFTAIVTFVISEIIGLILNPFGLFSFGGWVARFAIFGALLQAINNASYYKFVKMGGRDG